MKNLSKNEMLLIVGGASTISGTIVNAFVDGIKIVLELGRSFGSAIRRLSSNNVCGL